MFFILLFLPNIAKSLILPPYYVDYYREKDKFEVIVNTSLYMPSGISWNYFFNKDLKIKLGMQSITKPGFISGKKDISQL